MQFTKQKILPGATFAICIQDGSPTFRLNTVVQAHFLYKKKRAWVQG